MTVTHYTVTVTPCPQKRKPPNFCQ